MNHIRQTLFYAGMAWIAGMCFSLECVGTGPDEAPAKEKKAKPAAGKAAAGEKAGGAKAGHARKPINLAPPEDPVVTALLASNPTTPSEIFHTAQLLLEAGQAGVGQAIPEETPGCEAR